ncbi:hypothetical protein DENSPDRAFT_778633 [Dentipellis sp. KUC8613]|nr:hypothetical protein DENSPDRAFT_778633 [Dentipellis sp. KUC8613]
MLVLHPSSTCDVCLDSFVLDAGYPDHRKAPCAIECGHVFCRPCLESLQRRACPLCRTEFDRETVRKLHVDIKPLSPGERLARPDAVGAIDAVDAEKEDLKARIVSMIREGAEGSAYQAFLQQTKDWLREQDQDEVRHFWSVD